MAKTLGGRLVDATARRPGGWIGRRAYGGVEVRSEDSLQMARGRRP